MTFELNPENMSQRITSIAALEAKASELRNEIQEPLDKLLYAAGLGSFCHDESIVDLWETSDGGLYISTEQTRGELDYHSYILPASIVKAADPMVAAAEYKRKADDRRRAKTLAEIERLKRTL